MVYSSIKGDSGIKMCVCVCTNGADLSVGINLCFLLCASVVMGVFSFAAIIRQAGLSQLCLDGFS